MTEAQPRTWEMFTHRYENEDGSYYHHFGDERYVNAYSPGRPMLRVRLTEDPAGEYMGWVPLKSRMGEDLLGTELEMVQRENLFETQFIYGYPAEEKRGRGHAVHLRVEELD